MGSRGELDTFQPHAGSCKGGCPSPPLHRGTLRTGSRGERAAESNGSPKESNFPQRNDGHEHTSAGEARGPTLRSCGLRLDVGSGRLWGKSSVLSPSLSCLLRSGLRLFTEGWRKGRSWGLGVGGGRNWSLGRPWASCPCPCCVLVGLRAESVICTSLWRFEVKVKSPSQAGEGAAKTRLAQTQSTTMSRVGQLRGRWLGGVGEQGHSAQESYPEPQDQVLPATHPCRG